MAGPGWARARGVHGPPSVGERNENIRWKAPVEGRGHSSPIVVGDLIFLTSATSGEKVPGAGGDHPFHG